MASKSKKKKVQSHVRKRKSKTSRNSAKSPKRQSVARGKADTVRISKRTAKAISKNAKTRKASEAHSKRNRPSRPSATARPKENGRQRGSSSSIRDQSNGAHARGEYSGVVRAISEIRSAIFALRKSSKDATDVRNALRATRKALSKARHANRKTFLGIAEQGSQAKAINSINQAETLAEIRNELEKVKAENEAFRAQAIAQEKRRIEQELEDESLDDDAYVKRLCVRLEDEDIDGYIARVGSAMTKRGYSREAWYKQGADEFQYSESDFYSTIMGSPPKLGT